MSNILGGSSEVPLIAFSSIQETMGYFWIHVWITQDSQRIFRYSFSEFLVNGLAAKFTVVDWPVLDAFSFRTAQEHFCRFSVFFKFSLTFSVSFSLFHSFTHYGALCNSTLQYLCICSFLVHPFRIFQRFFLFFQSFSSFFPAKKGFLTFLRIFCHFTINFQIFFRAKNR